MEYEDLPLICFHCGKDGHTNEFSKETDHARAIAMNMDIGIEKDFDDENGNLKPWPWMHAPRTGNHERIQVYLGLRS